MWRCRAGSSYIIHECKLYCIYDGRVDSKILFTITLTWQNIRINAVVAQSAKDYTHELHSSVIGVNTDHHQHNRVFVNLVGLEGQILIIRNVQVETFRSFDQVCIVIQYAMTQ